MMLPMKASSMDTTLEGMPKPRGRLRALHASMLSSWPMLPGPVGTSGTTSAIVSPRNGTGYVFALPGLCPTIVGPQPVMSPLPPIA